MIDPFDPNHLNLDAVHEFRIYADDRAQVWAVVDEVDYLWAIKYLWSLKWSRGRTKCYLRRNGQEGVNLARVRKTIFLHKAIMLISGVPKPSPDHYLVDHRDGDAFNCRRSNLRWATKSMNSLNRFGKFAGEFYD